MSWITIVWSMNAGCVFDAGGDLSASSGASSARAGRICVFSCQRCGGGGHRRFELAMMHAETVGQYEALIRWIHVPVWVLICLVCGFRATLSPRRTTMAGVEYLRSADTGADSQFHFDAES